MTSERRTRLLKLAAKMVKEVAMSLDQKIGNCECCGAYKYENKAHFHMKEELDTTVRKLNKHAQRFEKALDFWDYKAR